MLGYLKTEICNIILIYCVLLSSAYMNVYRLLRVLAILEFSRRKFQIFAFYNRTDIYGQFEKKIVLLYIQIRLVGSHFLHDDSDQNDS